MVARMMMAEIRDDLAKRGKQSISAQRRKQVRELRKQRNRSGVEQFKRLGLKAGTGKVNDS